MTEKKPTLEYGKAAAGLHPFVFWLAAGVASVAGGVILAVVILYLIHGERFHPLLK